MLVTVKSLVELPDAARKLITGFHRNRVFVFYGELGAGKTTFIKEICHQLEVVDLVSSPTFALINEYKTIEDQPVYHFDFYRIKNASEAMDIGFEEYIYSGEYCLIEWPENVQKLLPENHVAVRIKEDVEGNRKITAEVN